MKAIYFYIGTTAEFIKISPVLKELKRRKVLFKIISAGQTHIRYEYLKDYVGAIKSDIELEEKLNKSSMAHFAWWAIKTFFTSVISLQNEFSGLNKNNCHFVIFGDPVSSVIGALVAKIYGLNLVHIESGDLSFDLTEPFPEEICRHINIHLADVMFPPTSWALDNLKKIDVPKINTGQNTIYECCIWAMSRPKKPEIISKLGKYYVLIMHRQEHVIFRKEWSRKTLEMIIKNAPKNLNCVIFEHALSTEMIKSLIPTFDRDLRDRILLIPQVPYADFIKLIQCSEFLATDGASNQQEVYYMGKPCLALRDKTEQIEGLDENVILYKSDENIAKNFLQNYKKYERSPVMNWKSPSKIVVDYLLTH